MTAKICLRCVVRMEVAEIGGIDSTTHTARKNAPFHHILIRTWAFAIPAAAATATPAKANSPI